MSVQCGFVMKGQCLFLVACSIISVCLRTLPSAPLALAFFAAPFSHELKAPVWSLRCAIFTRCLSCHVSLRFASWPPFACSVKLLSMLIGFCTCKVRNILTLISLFSVCRWLMELQVSTVLPLSFQQVGFYFCLELTGVINRSMFWRTNARASGEAA